MKTKKSILLILGLYLLTPHIGMGTKKAVSPILKKDYSEKVQAYFLMLSSRDSLRELKQIQPRIHRFVDKHIKNFGFKKRMKGLNIQLLPYATTTPAIFYRGEIAGGTIFMVTENIQKQIEIDTLISGILKLKYLLENDKPFTKTLKGLFSLYKKRNTDRKRARVEINYFLDKVFGCRYILRKNNTKYDLEKERRDLTKPGIIYSTLSFQNLIYLLTYLLKKYNETNQQDEDLRKKIYQTLFKMLIYQGKITTKKSEKKINRAGLIGKKINEIVKNKKILTDPPTDLLGFEHPAIGKLPFQTLFNNLLTNVGLKKPKKANENNREKIKIKFMGQLTEMLNKFITQLKNHLKENKFNEFEKLYPVVKQRIIDCSDFFDTTPWHEQLEKLLNEYLQKKENFKKQQSEEDLKKKEEEQKIKLEKLRKKLALRKKRREEKERKQKEQEEELKKRKEAKGKIKELVDKIKKTFKDKEIIFQGEELPLDIELPDRDENDNDFGNLLEEAKKTLQAYEQFDPEIPGTNDLKQQKKNIETLLDLYRLKKEDQKKKEEELKKMRERLEQEKKQKEAEEEKRKKEAQTEIQNLLDKIKNTYGDKGIVFEGDDLPLDIELPERGEDDNDFENLLEEVKSLQEKYNEYDSKIPEMDDLKRERKNIETLLRLYEEKIKKEEEELKKQQEELKSKEEKEQAAQNEIEELLTKIRDFYSKKGIEFKIENGTIFKNELTLDIQLTEEDKDKLENFLQSIENLQEKHDPKTPRMNELETEKINIQTLLDLHELQEINKLKEPKDILQALNDIDPNEKLKDIIDGIRSKHEKTVKDKLKEEQGKCEKLLKKHELILEQKEQVKRIRKQKKIFFNESEKKNVKNDEIWIKGYILQGTSFYMALQDEKIIEWQDEMRERLKKLLEGFFGAEEPVEEKDDEEESTTPEEAPEGKTPTGVEEKFKQESGVIKTPEDITLPPTTPPGATGEEKKETVLEKATKGLVEKLDETKTVIEGLRGELNSIKTTLSP